MWPCSPPLFSALLALEDAKNPICEPGLYRVVSHGALVSTTETKTGSRKRYVGPNGVISTGTRAGGRLGGSQCFFGGGSKCLEFN